MSNAVSLYSPPFGTLYDILRDLFSTGGLSRETIPGMARASAARVDAFARAAINCHIYAGRTLRAGRGGGEGLLFLHGDADGDLVLQAVQHDIYSHSRRIYGLHN